MRRYLISICMYCKYWTTGARKTTTESPKHLLVTPHPGGPTQGTPGHVPNHFLTPSQSPPSTRFFDFSNIFVLWCILPWQ